MPGLVARKSGASVACMPRDSTSPTARAVGLSVVQLEKSMTRSWWVFLLYGLMAIVFGLFALFQPQATMRMVMLAVGLLALGDGLVSLLTVFR